MLVALGSFAQCAVDEVCDDLSDSAGVMTPRGFAGAYAPPLPMATPPMPSRPAGSRPTASRDLLSLLFALGEHLTASSAQSGE